MKITVTSIEEVVRYTPYDIGEVRFYRVLATLEDVEHPRIISATLSSECYDDLCKPGRNLFGEVAEFMRSNVTV